MELRLCWVMALALCAAPLALSQHCEGIKVQMVQCHFAYSHSTYSHSTYSHFAYLLPLLLEKFVHAVV